MRGGKSKSKGSQYNAFDGHGFRGLTGNMTLFEYFSKGCFTKQEFFCSNRLTDYYCVIWTNLTETRQINSTYVSMSKTEYYFDECGGDFTSESIQILNMCFLPLLLVFGLLCNLLLCYFASQFAGKQLPICYYISLLAFLDFLLLWWRAGDLWIQSIGSINLSYIVLITNRSTCQLYTAMYSFLAHLKSCLHVALAIDTWRLVRDPIKTISFYTSEWILNSIILICVLLVPINCQFVWTFDVVRQSVVNSLDGQLFCGFAVKWPVDERFFSFIWPLMDLMVGDILPQISVLVLMVMSVISIFCRHSENTLECFEDAIRKSESVADGSSTSLNKMRRRNKENMAKYILNVDLFTEMRKALVMVNIIYVVFFFPTMVHNASMYWPYAAHQWSVVTTGGGKDLTESSISSTDTHKESQISISSMSISHDKEQMRFLFVKLLALVQMVANPVTFLIFVRSFRFKLKNLFLRLFIIKFCRQITRFYRFNEFQSFTQQTQSCLREPAPHRQRNFSGCTSV